MSEAAARPWLIRGTVKRGDLSIRSAVPNDDLYNIATLSSKGPAGFSPERVEAHARLIIHRVNAHDSLVEALARLALWERDENAFHEQYGRPEYEDSSIGWEAWREKELRAPARAALDEAKP